VPDGGHEERELRLIDRQERTGEVENASERDAKVESVLTLDRQRHVYGVAIFVDGTHYDTVARDLGADRRFVDHRAVKQVANLSREIAGGFDERPVSVRHRSCRGGTRSSGCPRAASTVRR
jgi:hypothetical protein